jgi:tetratricopeptide (TPR) repeat protein
MRFVFCGLVAVWALAAQDFDDLARRAEAALSGNPQQAAALYRQAVEMRPSWAEGWFYLGASEYQLKNYSGSREAFVHTTELAAENGAAWGFLGLCEYELQDYLPALTHIHKAEGLPLPENPQFISGLRVHAAMIYMRASDFTSAVEQLRPLVATGDNSPPVMQALGVAALTLPFIPPDVPAGQRPLVDLAGRATWNMYAHHAQEAGALFDQLGSDFPKEPGVHYLRGVYFVERDSKKALAEFRKELELNPKHVMARVQIAVINLKSGDPKAALGPAREAVKLAPGNFLCHLALGRSLFDSDQIASAIAEFETAAKLAPAYPHTHFYLGTAYRAAGKEEQARKEMAEFTRLKAQDGVH